MMKPLVDYFFDHNGTKIPKD